MNITILILLYPKTLNDGAKKLYDIENYVTPSEMMEVMEDREVWRLNLELPPPQPSRKSGQ